MQTLVISVNIDGVFTKKLHSSHWKYRWAQQHSQAPCWSPLNTVFFSYWGVITSSAICSYLREIIQLRICDKQVFSIPQGLPNLNSTTAFNPITTFTITSSDLQLVLIFIQTPVGFQCPLTKQRAKPAKPAINIPSIIQREEDRLGTGKDPQL